MTALVILALLAGNVFLAKMLIAKDKPQIQPDKETKSETKPDEREGHEEPESEADKIATVIGKSTFEPEEYRKLVKEVVKEVVPLIIEEYGSLADAGLPEPPGLSKKDMQVPVERLDEIFSEHTIAEIMGEKPEPVEPQADGVDFEAMNTTMKVVKGKSDKAEDMAVAKDTLEKIDGTPIKDKLSLDPEIQKRILLIELHLPKSDESPVAPDESIATDNDVAKPEKPKKILFHADIDTTDIDLIDFNVIH